MTSPKMLSYLYDLCFQCISTSGSINLRFMFRQYYQVIFCSSQGDMVVALDRRCLYLPATEPYLCLGSQCVNMRNTSARDNVLSSAIEIVSNVLIFKGFPLCPTSTTRFRIPLPNSQNDSRRELTCTYAYLVL